MVEVIARVRSIFGIAMFGIHVWPCHTVHMSDELTAALVGALIGTGATVIVTLLGRWWTSRDARASSRRLYSEQVERRLRSFVDAETIDELQVLNDDAITVSGLSRYVPARAGAVHLWFVYQQGRLFQDAVEKVNVSDAEDLTARGELQIKLFGDVLDVIQEINNWARGSFSRTSAWFWLQLRTTDRYQWFNGRRAGRLEEKRIVAARRSRSQDARRQLRNERNTSSFGSDAD